MEIASPSILDSLRSIFASDQVTKVVCVPYFLSPGRHATEDVPNLIDEARRILVDEGVIPSSIDETSMDCSILVSDALGTQLECMLRGLDILVENTLSEEQ
jgi:sirohydrochlorin ferrochelatase